MGGTDLKWDGRVPLTPAVEGPASLHDTRTVNPTLEQCECYIDKKLSLQELSQTIYGFHAGKNESDSSYISLLLQNKTYTISKLQITERIKFSTLLQIGNVLNQASRSHIVCLTTLCLHFIKLL